MGLITLSDIKLPIGKDEKELIRIAEKKLGGKVGYFAIKKKSLDARDKGNVRFVYTIEFSKALKRKKRRFLKNYLPLVSRRNTSSLSAAALRGCSQRFVCLIEG